MSPTRVLLELALVENLQREELKRHRGNAEAYTDPDSTTWS
jgi:hypothetical protein